MFRPNHTFRALITAGSVLALASCASEDPEMGDIAFDVTSNTQIAAAGAVDYEVTGLTDGQAYRITLVVDGNVTVTGAAGVFVDADENGAADAGASENVALITSVNGTAVAAGGAKTVPAGTDDPGAPTGIFPSNGTIRLTVTGVGAGTVFPVLYENGGASTFLEIDAAGNPLETYVVGGGVEVTGATGVIQATPATESTIDAAGTTDYVVTGLNDAQAYRITLVVAANITTSGDGTGTFIDADENGAADAGASEEVGLITTVGGIAGEGAKTVPAGTDDPSDPSGVFPSGGMITLSVTGVAEGTVYPVVYENGGASTFLEIDSAGAPTETYYIASATTVSP